MTGEAASIEGHYLPTGEYVVRQPVRAYEPSANGRLGPGNVLRYCELAANLASTAAGFGPQWYLERGEGWVIFRQTVEFGAGIGNGDTLELMTWVQSITRVSSIRNYRLTNAATGATVARAATTWAYVERASQTPRRIPAEFAHMPQSPRPSLIARPAWDDTPGHALPPTQVEWWARGYEADTLKHVNNCVYADWLHEAARLSFMRWAALDPRFEVPPLARRFTLHYQRSALPGDVIAIATAPAAIGRRGVVLEHTIAPRDNAATPLLTATTWYAYGI